MNMDKEIIDLLMDYSGAGWVSLKNARDLAVRAGISLPDMEKLAMQQEVVPLRYRRNIGTITATEQQVLMNARVAVIGCGGLGGNVVEQLARLGVGNILVWDYDCFEEHNLNRQLLSSLQAIGQSKVEAALKRVAAINPAANIQGITIEFDRVKGLPLLAGYQAVVDALDNIPSRLQLSALCRELQIPLVHGAVEGWIGQLTTQFPGESVIEKIYSKVFSSEKKSISTPVFTPALVASLQVAEIVKILLGRGELLRNRIMLVNLLDMDMETIDLF
ncbi:MAG: HesA/MoeB/ThiF family protein [Syntrophomonadaceae bacterium]|jgi:molybdopterin/thiamine biosynthesis adenylyltransferase